MMQIKNYTTKIPTEKTIMEIEWLLLEFGASKTMKEYHGDGTPYTLCFEINQKAYKLPANIEKVKERLKELRKVPESKLDEQAPRVAWRIIKDWLHAQLSLIYIGQAEIDQILLPYMFNGENTVYELYKKGQLQLEQKKGAD